MESRVVSLKLDLINVDNIIYDILNSRKNEDIGEHKVFMKGAMSKKEVAKK